MQDHEKTPIKEATIEDFPLRTYEKLRYVDTDRQGHINNAVFASMMETGRVGRSSITLEQGLFQNGHCAAIASTVIVHVGNTGDGSRPLPAPTVELLNGLR